MATKKPSEMSLEELQKTEKTLKMASATLIGMVLGMAVMGIYLTINKGFNFFSVFFLFFTPMIFVNRMNLKNLQKEIASRV
jgi:uncharacterized membrane protein